MMRPIGQEEGDASDPDEAASSADADMPLNETDPLAAWRYSCILVAEKAQLSEREVDVLNLLARGYSACMVSDELCISYNTTRNHIQRIYTKLDVHSRDELHVYFKEIYDMI